MCTLNTHRDDLIRGSTLLPKISAASLSVLPSASSKTDSIRLTPSRTRFCYVFFTDLVQRTLFFYLANQVFVQNSHLSSFHNRRIVRLLSNSFEC